MREIRLMGNEARAAIPMKYLISDPFLRVICKTAFRGGRSLDTVPDDEIKIAWKRGAGISVDPPDGLRFIERVSRVTRMNAAEPVSQRVLNVEIGRTKCIIDNEWMEPVCPGGVWVQRYGRAVVEAVINGIYPAEFRAEI